MDSTKDANNQNKSIENIETEKKEADNNNHNNNNNKMKINVPPKSKPIPNKTVKKLIEYNSCDAINDPPTTSKGPKEPKPSKKIDKSYQQWVIKRGSPSKPKPPKHSVPTFNPKELESLSPQQIRSLSINESNAKKKMPK